MGTGLLGTGIARRVLHLVAPLWTDAGSSGPWAHASAPSTAHTSAHAATSSHSAPSASAHASAATASLHGPIPPLLQRPSRAHSTSAASGQASLREILCLPSTPLPLLGAMGSKPRGRVDTIPPRVLQTCFSTTSLCLRPRFCLGRLPRAVLLYLHRRSRACSIHLPARSRGDRSPCLLQCAVLNPKVLFHRILAYSTSFAHYLGICSVWINRHLLEIVKSRF